MSHALQPKLIYSPEYNLHCYGFERLHPFDGCKYRRVWNLLNATYRHKLAAHTLRPQHEISAQQLQRVHTPEYLNSLRLSQCVTRALELSLLSFMPMWLIEKRILRPMRLATQGTLMAAEQALQHGIAVNLSGGYHHAMADRGEGFCVYADVAVAIAELRARGALNEEDRVLIIDLDAHQGQGNERLFMNDERVFILDLYNRDIYPRDEVARRRINFDLGVYSGTSDETYLRKLKQTLPQAIEESGARIAFYNAGTDIYSGDSLGNLNVSEEGILERDKYVFNMLNSAQVPCAMVLSGGYSRESYQLVANSLRYLLDTWGNS